MLRIACFISSLVLILPAHAATGESWEYTNQMNMPGMSMPSSTTKVCKEAGWDKPPQTQQRGSEQCQTSQFNRNANTITWQMKCPEGIARGRMTFQGNDSFTGATEFESDRGKFTMNLSGRRVGSCEIAEGKGVQVEGTPNRAGVR